VEVTVGVEVADVVVGAAAFGVVVPVTPAMVVVVVVVLLKPPATGEVAISAAIARMATAPQ
jgi:hypothetical protein